MPFDAAEAHRRGEELIEAHNDEHLLNDHCNHHTELQLIIL
jgi:hypothetical protein